MEYKNIIYLGIIFIAGLILGSIASNSSQQSRIDYKDEQIKSLTYSRDSFHEDYSKCLTDKSNLRLDYENQLENKQNTIDLYKIQCGDTKEKQTTTRIPLSGYYNGYYNNSFVTTFFCDQITGTGDNLYYSLKMYGKKSCGYEQLFSRSGNVDTSNIQRNCQDLWLAFLDSNTNITKSLLCWCNKNER